MSKLNYKTSKDYKQLKELLDKGEEVIVLNCPLIGYAQKVDDWYWFGGQTHIESREFLSFCREQSVEFIEPNGRNRV